MNEPKTFFKAFVAAFCAALSIVSPNGTVIYSYETAEEFEPSRRKRRREIKWPLESSSMPPLGT